MRNNKEEIRKLVFAAIMLAFIFLFSLLYFFQIGFFASITIAHLPVLIGAIVLGKKYGALLGFFFGLFAMIIAFLTLGANAPFTNPLLSILPRIFFGWIIYFIYQYFGKKIKDQVAAVGITMAVSTILHSFIVLALLFVVAKTGFYFTASENPATISQGIIPFIIAVFGVNGLIEVALAVIVGTPIVFVLKKIKENDNID